MELRRAALALAAIVVTTSARPCFAAGPSHSNPAEIHFAVEGVHGKEAPAVTVDGVAVAAPAVSAPYKLDPGHHVVVATLNGVERRYEVDLVEGETANVVLDFLGVEEPVAPAPAPATAPTGPHANYTLAIVGFGVGAAALGLGVIGSMVAVSYRDNAALGCTADKRCPPHTFHNLDAAETWANVSTVSFVTAAVGVGVGVVGLFTARSSAAPAKTGYVVPWIGPTSAGLRGSF